jgi:hypothetical protein
VVSLSRYTGAALGTAIFGAFVFALASTGGGRFDPHNLAATASAQLTHAIRSGFVVLAAVAAAGAWFASRMQKIRL